MTEPSMLATNVKLAGDFKNAAPIQPIMVISIRPEVIPKIISNLSLLKGRTDDSEIVQMGHNYAFMDKRTNLPLAELDTSTGTLSMYKSPKDMAARIDSTFVSVGTITDFIKTSRVPEQPPSVTATAQPVGQMASR